ncbi:MAG: Spy/CpxP family protein refolding chaperone [Candidatus Cryptobacteroides sp.]
MKKIFLTILLCFSALAAFCQEKAEEVNQKYFDAKIREFVYRLELTDSQRDAFIPIYKQYSGEMRAAVGARQKDKERPATSEEAAARTKEHIERQQRAQAVRLKYVDEFAAVLKPGQLSRLYDVEDQIQRKLMNEKNKRKGKPGMPGMPGARNPQLR